MSNLSNFLTIGDVATFKKNIPAVIQITAK